MFSWKFRNKDKDAPNPRLFFSINSGRAGSRYLAELLDTAEGVRAFHEPDPAMTGPYLRMINVSEYRETYEKRRIKYSAIRRRLKKMGPEEVYCETNHMFIKTFFDVVAAEFNNIEVILLRRDVTVVLKSFIEMGYFSDVNTVWPGWMSSPNARTRAVDCIDSDAYLDQYDLCIAYLIDIEARARRFMRDYPHIPVHEVRLEQLNTVENVESFFAALRITPTEETASVIGSRTNSREARKQRLNNPTTLETCRERIEEYLRKAARKGAELPPLAFAREKGEQKENNA